MIKLSDLLFGYKKRVLGKQIWLNDELDLDLAYIQFFPIGEMPIGNDGGNWLFMIQGDHANYLFVPCIECGRVMQTIRFDNDAVNESQRFCFHCRAHGEWCE